MITNLSTSIRFHRSIRKALSLLWTATDHAVRALVILSLVLPNMLEDTQAAMPAQTTKVTDLSPANALPDQNVRNLMFGDASSQELQPLMKPELEGNNQPVVRPALVATTGGEIRGYWRFEQDLTDASGYKNTGTGTVTYASGFYGFGLNRNGTQLPIPLPSSGMGNSLIISNQITIEAWVNSANYGAGYHHIIDNYNGYALSIQDGVPAVMFRGPTSWWKPPSAPVLSLNQWHYIVGTYDGTQDAVYVDGQMIAVRSATGAVVSTSQTALGGIGTGGSSLLFNGILDNVKVTARALTASEVLANYKGFPASQAFADNECPFCNISNRTYFAGQGINVYSGNYSHQWTDIQVPGLGDDLNFERSYNSLTTGVPGYLVYNDVLGYGWTHNYNMRLVFNPPGEANTVILIGPHGSQFRFIDKLDGTYSSYPAVFAGLTRTGTSGNYTYLVTTNSNINILLITAGNLPK